jgi:hypothetical protein
LFMSDPFGRDDFDLTRQVVTEVDFQAGCRADDAPDATDPDCEALGTISLLGNFTATGTTSASAAPATSPDVQDDRGPDSSVSAVDPVPAALGWRHPADEPAATLPTDNPQSSTASASAAPVSSPPSRLGRARTRGKVIGIAAAALVPLIAAAVVLIPGGSAHRQPPPAFSQLASLGTLSSTVGEIAAVTSRTRQPAPTRAPATQHQTRRHPATRQHHKTAAHTRATRHTEGTTVTGPSTTAPVDDTPATSDKPASTDVTSQPASSDPATTAAANTATTPSHRPAFGEQGVLGPGTSPASK